jgi:hypothetical protein
MSAIAIGSGAVVVGRARWEGTEKGARVLHKRRASCSPPLRSCLAEDEPDAAATHLSYRHLSGLLKYCAHMAESNRELLDAFSAKFAAHRSGLHGVIVRAGSL